MPRIGPPASSGGRVYAGWAEAPISPAYALSGTANEAIFFCIHTVPVDCQLEVELGCSAYCSAAGMQLLYLSQLRASDGTTVLATSRTLGAAGHLSGTFPVRLTPNITHGYSQTLSAGTTVRAYFLARRDGGGASGTISVDYWWARFQYNTLI